MKSLTKPKRLNAGDKVAAITLSWGGPGEYPHRYQVGKQQLEEKFGVQVIETKNALKSADWIYKNPKARAEDLMEAFLDPSIKAIFSTIGGEDSIRILPFIDLSIIQHNPKIFLGMSDTTITHLACYKAGLTSFYGTGIMAGFAENGGMHPYQIDDINRTLFSTRPVGAVLPNEGGWTTELLDWKNIELQNVKRRLTKSNGWNFLQGKGSIQGRLLGGCVEVLEFLKETEYWPELNDWQGAIMFLETSEEKVLPQNFRWILRNYAAAGILHKLNGLMVGRPYDNQYFEDYNKIIIQIINEEEGLTDLHIITEMDFGHTSPSFTIPIGVMAEIDSDHQSFRMIESGVIE